MKKDLKITPGIFPMPVLMIGTYNEDGAVEHGDVPLEHGGTWGRSF